MKLPPQMKAIPPPRIGTPTSPPPPANDANGIGPAGLQNGGGGGGGGGGTNANEDTSLPPPPLEAQAEAGKARMGPGAANGKILHNGTGGPGGVVTSGGDDDDDLPPPPPAITDESNYAVTEL